jgi:hypothetical protein
MKANIKNVLKTFKAPKMAEVWRAVNYKKNLPSHLRRYPNMKFQKNHIIDFELRAKGEPNFKDAVLNQTKVSLDKQKYRIPTNITQAK